MKNRKKFVSIMAGILAAVMLLTLILSILPAGASAATSSSEIRNQIDELEKQQAELDKEMAEIAKVDKNVRYYNATVEEAQRYARMELDFNSQL